MEWKEIPILLKRRKVLMARIVRRWRKTHLTRGVARWRTFTVAERIVGRKRKPQGAPPPVVEEELSSKSAILQRKLERGWMLSASEGIPSYDPLRDKHATYAHTEHYREKQRQLKYEQEADRKATRVRFPGQLILKELKEEKKQRLLRKNIRGRKTREKNKRPASAPRDRNTTRGQAGRSSGGRSGKGGARGPRAAMEARRTASLQDLGRKYNNWTENSTLLRMNPANNGEISAASTLGSLGLERNKGDGSNRGDGGDGGDGGNGGNRGEEIIATLHAKMMETEQEAQHQEESARMLSKQVKELELQIQINEQRSSAKTQQLQEVLSATDDKAQELQETADNLALELASRKRRAKGQLEDAQSRYDDEVSKREELERQMELLNDHLEREKHSNLKRERIVREEARKETMLIEKEKRKHLINPSVVKKIERENKRDVHQLQKKLDQQRRIEEELERKVELEKLKGQDAIEDALTSAKETLEAQQHLVRQAEDRSLKNHLVATKMKKVVRDMSVKLEEKMSVMEEEMESMTKQLARTKRLLKQEKRRAKATTGGGGGGASGKNSKKKKK